MGKTIKRIRKISFALIIIQLISIAAFFMIYFNDNIFGLMKYINPIYIPVGAAGLVAFNCIYIWIISMVISTLRSKTDLHAAEIIGGDVQEAYNFAMVGLVVTDENDVVIWTNDIFKDRHIDIIDMNILSWQPDLRSLKDAASSAAPEGVVKIVINSRNYEVKYLIEAGLWIFRDTTEYESQYKYSKEQSTVVGILTIDNYTDAMVGETEDFNDAVSKVKNVIFTYTKEYGVLLRKFKDDSYSMLCNFKSLEDMVGEIIFMVTDNGN
jgi:c-di-AMP phosphodiesterase-like protein